ncbi:GntR family transcriptional regulator [Streptoalloteichus tenebrarius]|nr:GntR family transcriptional regulator [Streptoalloteichus tenebrarius]
MTKWRQIADALREKIEAGEYRPGQRLPTEPELQEQYDVSRNTVRQAVSSLVAEGLLLVERGQGTRVRPRSEVRRLARSRLSREERKQGRGAFLSDATQAGFTPSVQVRVSVGQADTRTAELLQIAEGDSVLRRERIMSADGRPMQLATSQLPRSITHGMQIEEEESGPGGTYARLEEAGHHLSHFVEEVAVRMPSAAEVETLQLLPGTPVFAITRIAYAGSPAKPVELNDIVLAGDQVRLVYEIPAE